MCSGPERVTLTDYGVTFFFIKAGAGIEITFAAFHCALERDEDMVSFFFARAR